MTNEIASVAARTPAPSVTREQVWQRWRRFCHQLIGLAAQDVCDRVLDFAIVLRLDDFVPLLLAVDLDRRAGGEVLVQRGFGVGLALVFGRALLERRAVLVGRDRVALHAAAFLEQPLGGRRVDLLGLRRAYAQAESRADDCDIKLFLD